MLESDLRHRMWLLFMFDGMKQELQRYLNSCNLHVLKINAEDETDS